MAALKPEVVVDSQCVLGPLWHPLERDLYWIDIVMGNLLRYDPRTRIHEQVYQGELIGGFAIQTDGAAAVYGRGHSLLAPRGTLRGQPTSA